MPKDLNSINPLRKRSFAPVVDSETRILILGSLPGEASLAQAQYYAHRQNRFWDLIGAVVDVSLRPLSYVDRLETLLKNGVGLWDVIAEAHREGSLDSAIRHHLGNDLMTLLDGLPKLTTIGFNGGTAAKVGERVLGVRAQRYRVVRLPSSSPAYASMCYADKLLVWKTLR